MPLGDTRVGPQVASDGEPIPVRLMKDAAVAKNDGHAHFREAVYRGNVFVAATAATQTTGVAPGTAFSTTAPICLFNPVGSGVNLDILKTSMIWIPGATANTTVLGAGFIAYGQSPQITVPAGTAIASKCCLLGSGNAPKASALTSATITTAPTIVRASGMNLQAVSAAAPTAGSGWQWEDLIDGEFVLTPGNVFVMNAIAAAGTSPLVAFSISWEETLI